MMYHFVSVFQWSHKTWTQSSVKCAEIFCLFMQSAWNEYCACKNLSFSELIYGKHSSVLEINENFEWNGNFILLNESNDVGHFRFVTRLLLAKRAMEVGCNPQNRHATSYFLSEWIRKQFSNRISIFIFSVLLVFVVS